MARLDGRVNTEVRIVRHGRDLFDWSIDAAVDVMMRTEQAAERSDPVRVALSGHPVGLVYAALATALKDQMLWTPTRFFLCDERWQPADGESNYQFIKETLFERAEVDATFIPIPTEGSSPEAAAEQYEATLRQEFGVEKGSKAPRFDVIVIGLGADGNLGSLFPHCSALGERQALVAATSIEETVTEEKVKEHRITLTPLALRSAWDVIVPAFGYDLEEPVAQALEGDYDSEAHPAQLLLGAPARVTWFVDRAAAARLQRSNTDNCLYVDVDE